MAKRPRKPAHKRKPYQGMVETKRQLKRVQRKRGLKGIVGS